MNWKWTEHPWNDTLGCLIKDFRGRDWRVCCMAHPDNPTIGYINTIEMWTWRAWLISKPDDVDADHDAEYIISANTNCCFTSKEYAMNHVETMLPTFGFTYATGDAC